MRAVPKKWAYFYAIYPIAATCLDGSAGITRYALVWCSDERAANRLAQGEWTRTATPHAAYLAKPPELPLVEITPGVAVRADAAPGTEAVVRRHLKLGGDHARAGTDRAVRDGQRQGQLHPADSRPCGHGLVFQVQEVS